MEPGRFIVLEGIDGSGTTSQCRALVDAFVQLGHAALATHEPSSGSIGRLVRERLASNAAAIDPHAMALLFAADRVDHVRTEIEPALAAGTHVVCDRYLMSSWAYQALSCNPAWVQQINEAAPWPDLTVLIDVPVEVAQARIALRAQTAGTVTEIYDRAELQLRVAAGYARLASEGRPGVHRIDGTAPPEAVTEALLAICLAAI